MTMFLYSYLIVGIIVTSVWFHLAMLSISSEKLNLNKYYILAIKIIMAVGFTIAYPIVILLITLGRDDE